MFPQNAALQGKDSQAGGSVPGCAGWGFPGHSEAAGGEGDLLPKPAEMEELWRSWSQGLLSLGFCRGEGFSNERARWEKENLGAEGQGTCCWGCQSTPVVGNAGDFRGGNQREE